jgi:N-acetylneuraminate synthase
MNVWQSRLAAAVAGAAPPYVIAEIGANHNGNLDLARRLIGAARAAGCDAAKFQSWGTGLFAQSFYDENEGLKEAIAAYAVGPAGMAELAAACRDSAIAFASSAFSDEEVAQLDALDPPFIKIASMDLNNDRMLLSAAATGRTIILSTGFSTLGEIEHAVATLERDGHRDTVLLHCVSVYPPPSDDMLNLRNLESLRRAFGYPVGFSDHTLGVEITLAALALGAVVIEKHFTLDRTMEGWDHAVSAEPQEMETIVRAAERIWRALGSERRVVSDVEREKSRVMRRSAVAARDIRAGEIVAASDIAFRRPGTGVAPNDAAMLAGRVAMRDIAADQLLTLEDFGMARGRQDVVRARAVSSAA